MVGHNNPFEGINRRGSLEPKDPRSPKRATVAALVLASATLFTLDQTPVLEPVRGALGEVFGPPQSVASAAARPVARIPDWFDSRSDLRDDVAALQSENAELKRELRTSDYGRNRLKQYEGLTQTAERLGYAIVPTRVIAMGEAQSFSRTVTIDAGSTSGLSPDMTVVNADGLVGRILRVTRSTATVLLIVDTGSVVGGRVGDSMQVGFVRGHGAIARTAQLDMQLVDQSVSPQRGSSVLTWASGPDAPYVAGVPIGEVSGVYASLRDSSRTVRVKPYVDFGALDVLGVVVPSGTASDRAVIDADGSLK